MPTTRQAAFPAPTSRLWPSGGAHRWPAGGVSTEHSHPRGHLVYAARGALTVRTEVGTSVVPANRVAWTPAGFAHLHRAHGDTDMRIEFLPASLAALLPGQPAVFSASPLAREALLALSGPRQRERGARSRLLRVLVDELSLVDELGDATEGPLQLPEPRDDRLRAAARILREHPADDSTLTDLGRSVGASARTLSRLLHDELGLSFHAWRTQLRVHHALVLLAEGHDTTHVAHACGWANPSGFIAAFADLVGTTPGRYRRTSGALRVARGS